MSRPTLEQYEKAKHDLECYAEWIAKSRRTQTALIDALAEERDREKRYQEIYDKNREIVMAYDFYAQTTEATTGKQEARKPKGERP